MSKMRAVPKPRLAFNLLQLYSLEAWEDGTWHEELPLQDCLDAFIAAIREWDGEGDGELEDYPEQSAADLTEALQLLGAIDEWADLHSSIFVWEKESRETLAEDEGWAGLMSDLSAFLARHEAQP